MTEAFLKLNSLIVRFVYLLVKRLEIYTRTHTHTYVWREHACDVCHEIAISYTEMEMVAVPLLTPLLLQLLLLLIFSMIFIFHPKWLFIEPMACAYCREWRDACNFPSSYEKRMSEAYTHIHTALFAKSKADIIDGDASNAHVHLRSQMLRLTASSISTFIWRKTNSGAIFSFSFSYSSVPFG